jgi:hypothetical protein
MESKGHPPVDRLMKYSGLVLPLFAIAICIAGSNRPIFEPKYGEFRPRTIWSLSNALTAAFKELDLAQGSDGTATVRAEWVAYTGDIVNPAPHEVRVGGHAMCLVGYIDLPDRPQWGGGHAFSHETVGVRDPEREKQLMQK